MARAHWLIKSEPTVYSFATLEKDGRTAWEGVRNYEARNNLRAMKVGDACLFYHSSTGKEIVGVVTVTKTAYADPTADEGDWSAVDVSPAYPLAVPVTLAAVKATKALANMNLVRKSRISVVPVSAEEFACVLAMGKTKPRK